MPNPSLYWRDGSCGSLRCAHGVILYGNSCVRCERGEFPPTVVEARGPTPAADDPAQRIARILHDMENLVLRPAQVARQARRLRTDIETLVGEPLPAVDVEWRE